MKKRILSSLLIIVMLLTAIPFAANAEETPNNAALSVSGTMYYSEAFEVLELVNKAREKEGLSPLTMDQKLLETAALRAGELSVYFSHTRPDDTSCFTAFPSGGASAENIAAGQTSASAVMESWLKSEGHKANIMSENYQSVGIGCFYHNGVYFWTQCFSSNAGETAEQPKDAETSAAVNIGSVSYTYTISGTGTMSIGASQTLSVSMKNRGWDYPTAKLDAASFTWSSSDASVATVEKGVVTAKAEGKATITATVGGCSATFDITVSWKNPFTDVKDGAWYFDVVRYAYENGLMFGMTETTFGPNTPLTRAMLVTILYRYEGAPKASGSMPFKDVAAGQYYTDAVDWAAANGIVSGMTATTFEPNTNITREQMVAILYRYAKYKGVDVSAQKSLDSFPDVKQLHDYAKEPMAWAVAEGIIVGDNGSLSPRRNATRAEVASVLQRYIQNIIEE